MSLIIEGTNICLTECGSGSPYSLSAWGSRLG